MSDLEAEKGVAVAALIVAIGVGLIMNHWVEDMWLCIGVGIITAKVARGRLKSRRPSLAQPSGI